MAMKDESKCIKQLNKMLSLNSLIEQDSSFQELRKPTKIHKYVERGPKVKEDKHLDGELSFTRSALAEGKRLAAMAKMVRCSNGGNQADDEEETFKDSDVSLAILGKKKL